MKELTEDSIALLREMIAVPSFSFEEDAVCSLVASRLASWGIVCRRAGNNIVAVNRYYSSSLPTLALDAHLDTVRPVADYSRDPFDSGENPSVVYGLGSNDDGGSVVSMIAAFRHFYERKDMPVNLALVLSCEEERSGSNGAHFIFGPQGPAEAAAIKWIIFGEPTGMMAATSERGLLVLDGEALGVSGHAARSEGVNALYIALEDIAALRSHRFEKTSDVMGDVKLSVTQISAGSAHNVIPDKCSFVVDIRPNDKYSNEEILSELQALCKSGLKARSLRNRSSSTPEGSLLLKTASELGIGTYSSPTTSNWMTVSGKDCIKMGPGESARSHRADEYILRSEIESAVSGYIEFIEKFYGNTLE